MNQNREVKNTEKQDTVLVDANVTHGKSLQADVNIERVFVMPSVPRPGITSWSLVL